MLPDRLDRVEGFFANSSEIDIRRVNKGLHICLIELCPDAMTEEEKCVSGLKKKHGVFDGAMMLRARATQVHKVSDGDEYRPKRGTVARAKERTIARKSAAPGGLDTLLLKDDGGDGDDESTTG